MYTSKNYATKKALKDDVAAGKKVSYYQPGPFGGNEPQDGTIVVEGPQYPKAHSWYASCKVVGGYIVSVK